MQASQTFQDLVLLLQAGLESFQGALGRTKFLLRPFKYFLEFLRTVKIIIHAGVIVLETVSVFAEDGFIETSGIGSGFE